MPSPVTRSATAPPAPPTGPPAAPRPAPPKRSASLTNGTEYEVQVQATNTAGDSGWSDSAKATPAAVPDTPAKPGLTAADQKLTASWSAPNNNGSAITGYKVRHRATGTNDWTTSSSQTGTSKEIGSLTNGTEYEVQVQATNAAGDSGWSDSAKATPYTTPSKPSPTLTAADQKTTASWSAPDDGGSDITGYKVPPPRHQYHQRLDHQRLPDGHLL